MEGVPEVENPNLEASPKGGLINRLARTLSKRYELAALGAITGFDLAREIATGDPFFTKAPPSIGAETLQHLGGIWDGYAASLLTFYGLSLLTLPIKEKISPQIKVAVSFLAGSAAVVAVETGLLGAPGRQVAEVADIWSGVAGSVIFAGVMLLNKNFINSCTTRIRSLERLIRQTNTNTTDTDQMESP